MKLSEGCLLLGANEKEEDLIMKLSGKGCLLLDVTMMFRDERNNAMVDVRKIGRGWQGRLFLGPRASGPLGIFPLSGPEAQAKVSFSQYAET
jgi:hypothetical protein